MIIDGTNLSAQNKNTSRRTVRLMGGILLVTVVALSSGCDALAQPSEFNSPAPASIPAGTNFYTKPMRLGDKACGATIKEITGVAPAKTETLPGGATMVVNDGYSHTVIASSLNRNNTCGSGDKEGLLWQQSQTVMLPGAGGLPG